MPSARAARRQLREPAQHCRCCPELFAAACPRSRSERVPAGTSVASASRLACSSCRQQRSRPAELDAGVKPCTTVQERLRTAAPKLSRRQLDCTHQITSGSTEELRGQCIGRHVQWANTVTTVLLAASPIACASSRRSLLCSTRKRALSFYSSE